MKFWIQRPHSMCVDNCILNHLDLSALPEDHYMVFWDGDLGKGEIEHNDIMPLRTPFTDPSPYLPFVFAWLVKAKYEDPPINIEQAKMIKQDIVKTLFNYKRQSRLNEWDCTDEATAAMTRLLTSAVARSLNGGPQVRALEWAAKQISLDQFAEMFAAIDKRRARLDAVRLSHQAKIEALTTVDDVIAYNLTTEW